jgi:hypothetical protein
MRLIGYVALLGGVFAFIYWDAVGGWVKGTVQSVGETAESTKAIREYANEMIDSAREKAADALRPAPKNNATQE